MKFEQTQASIVSETHTLEWLPVGFPITSNKTFQENLKSLQITGNWENFPFRNFLQNKLMRKDS